MAADPESCNSSVGAVGASEQGSRIYMAALLELAWRVGTALTSADNPAPQNEGGTLAADSHQGQRQRELSHGQ